MVVTGRQLAQFSMARRAVLTPACLWLLSRYRLDEFLDDIAQADNYGRLAGHNQGMPPSGIVKSPRPGGLRRILGAD